MGSFQGPSRAFSFNGVTGFDQRTIYTMTATGTVGNTGAETTLIGTGTGTLTIPANYLAVGSVIKIYTTGTIGTDAVVPLITLKAYYGGTAVSTVSATPPSQVAAGTVFEYTTTHIVTAIGSSGSITTSQIMWLNSIAISALTATPGATTVNTTLASALDLKITWGTAAALNTASLISCYVELIG